MSSSATLGSDLLFFGTDAFYLYAVEAATGAVSWSCLAKDAITGAPTLSSDSKSLCVALCAVGRVVACRIAWH